VQDGDLRLFYYISVWV